MNFFAEHTATAILDLFLHHAEIITITGYSYRLRPRSGQANRNDVADEQKNSTKTREKDCQKPAI